MAGRLTLAKQAIDCFGIEAQILKFAEECCESEEKEHDHEEHADVLVCLDQMAVVFGCELADEIKKAKQRPCAVYPKAFSKAAAHAIKYALYLRAGWNAEEIKTKLLEAIAQVVILLEFRIDKHGNREAAERAKNQKEIRLFDTICRVRSERVAGYAGDISSGQASRFQRGDCIKQGRSRTV